MPLKKATHMHSKLMSTHHVYVVDMRTNSHPTEVQYNVTVDLLKLEGCTCLSKSWVFDFIEKKKT